MMRFSQRNIQTLAVLFSILSTVMAVQRQLKEGGSGGGGSIGGGGGGGGGGDDDDTSGGGGSDNSTGGGGGGGDDDGGHSGHGGHGGHSEHEVEDKGLNGPVLVIVLVSLSVCIGAILLSMLWVYCVSNCCGSASPPVKADPVVPSAPVKVYDEVYVQAVPIDQEVSKSTCNIV